MLLVNSECLNDMFLKFIKIQCIFFSRRELLKKIDEFNAFYEGKKRQSLTIKKVCMNWAEPFYPIDFTLQFAICLWINHVENLNGFELLRWEPNILTLSWWISKIKKKSKTWWLYWNTINLITCILELLAILYVYMHYWCLLVILSQCIYTHTLYFFIPFVTSEINEAIKM